MGFSPDIVGSIAAILTTVSFLPQLVKVLRTRETRDISLSMYLMFTTGVFLWTVYGIMLDRLPMILANSITFLMALVILVMKLQEKKS